MGNKQTTENGQFGTINKDQKDLGKKGIKNDWQQKKVDPEISKKQSSSFDEGDVQGSDV